MFLQLVKVEQRGPVRMSVEVVGDNVLNNDLAIVEIGEPQGVCQGFIRIGGKVRRKKNLFEDYHLRPLLNSGSPGFTLPTARAVPSVEMTRNPLPAWVSAPQVFCRVDCVLQICQKCVVEERSDCQFVPSSAPRTEPAEMTTRARSNHRTLPEIQNASAAAVSAL